jgi:hypothetical protein
MRAGGAGGASLCDFFRGVCVGNCTVFGWQTVDVEKQISPLRCSQMRDGQNKAEKIWAERFWRPRRIEVFGILRCAQDDSRNLQCKNNSALNGTRNALAQCSGESGGFAVTRWGGIVAGCGRRRQVLPVDADVKAGLLKLLFHVDFAFLYERQEVAPEPGDLGQGEAVLRNVDGLASEVRRGGVAFGGRGVAVDVHQALLEFDGADGGVDLQRRVKVSVVGAGQGGEKLRNPGSAVAPVYRKTFVDLQGVTFGKGDQQPFAAHLHKVFVVPDAVEAVAVSYLVLTDQDLARALERWRDDEAAALVIEAGQDDGGCGGLFYAGQLGPWGVAPRNTDYGSWFGY